VMCGNSILSCCPRNPHRHERSLKEEKYIYMFFNSHDANLFYQQIKEVVLARHRVKRIRRSSESAAPLEDTIMCTKLRAMGRQQSEMFFCRSNNQ